MKVIDAVWEKRNLGIETREILLNENDTIDDLSKVIFTQNRGYYVVKSPIARVDLTMQLEANGYNFIECAMAMEFDLRKIDELTSYTRIESLLSSLIASEDEYDSIFANIKSSTMFKTDRIALDPQFSEQVSASRYVNWLKDEVKQGTDLYHYIFKGEKIGFFSLKDKGEGKIYSQLAGLYNNLQIPGVGYGYTLISMREAKNRNGKKLEVGVSTNNSNALRILVEMGFNVKNIHYVFTKYIN